MAKLTLSVFLHDAEDPYRRDNENSFKIVREVAVESLELHHYDCNVDHHLTGITLKQVPDDWEDVMGFVIEGRTIRFHPCIDYAGRALDYVYSWEDYDPSKDRRPQAYRDLRLKEVYAVLTCDWAESETITLVDSGTRADHFPHMTFRLWTPANAEGGEPMNFHNEFWRDKIHDGMTLREAAETYKLAEGKQYGGHASPLAYSGNDTNLAAKAELLMAEFVAEHRAERAGRVIETSVNPGAKKRRQIAIEDKSGPDLTLFPENLFEILRYVKMSWCGLGLKDDLSTYTLYSRSSREIGLSPLTLFNRTIKGWHFLFIIPVTFENPDNISPLQRWKKMCTINHVSVTHAEALRYTKTIRFSGLTRLVDQLMDQVAGMKAALHVALTTIRNRIERGLIPTGICPKGKLAKLRGKNLYDTQQSRGGKSKTIYQFLEKIIITTRGFTGRPQAPWNQTPNEPSPYDLAWAAQSGGGAFVRAQQALSPPRRVLEL